MSGEMLKKIFFEGGGKINKRRKETRLERVFAK
jgi:hypothetical protein